MAASILQQHISKIRSPVGGEKVHKDECAYSFDTPEHENGLYVCMNTFLGFGKRQVERHFNKTGNAVFLHVRRIKRELPKKEDEEKKKPTKMAIGMEGGFDVGVANYEFEEHNSIVVLPEWKEIPLDDPEIPPEVQISAATLIAADSAARAEELAALAGTWDGEKRIISKFAENLQQLDNGVKIPPSGWKCSKCDLTQNLWLNLTDGAILCGRRFWDGTGGNNHAVDHFKETNHPLCVKLGTITSDSADVFSYAEDEMVEDPWLAKHLAHFGINVAQLEKTDKTMAELEIDLNQKVGEWDVIQEAGLKLKPLHGGGYTGMINLGNSCYMNSVVQMLFTIPDFQQRYSEKAEAIFNSASGDPTSDFNIQMAKLGQGLLSGEYSRAVPEEPEVITEPTIRLPNGIRPQMFKSLVGRGHPEFSTRRQQDAQEFLLHLLNSVERNSRGSVNPTDSMKFDVEERIQCGSSGKVKYTRKSDFLLSLPIPMEAATNKEAVAEFEAKKKQLEAEKRVVDPKDIVRPRISLASCLEAFAAPATVEDFFSTAINAKSTATKTTRLATFPDYLVLQMQKFTISEDWSPKKLDVSLDMPDEVDISHLRATGQQPGEEQLPEQSQEEQEAQTTVQIDEGMVSQLMEMGFPFDACRRAVFHTGNSGVEAAMNWVMAHMDDPDFGAPFVPPSGGGGGKKASSFTPDEDALGMIMAMGFTRDQATRALKETNNNVERAADWIFSHADELDAPMETDAAPEADGAAAPEASQGSSRDGSGRYKLVGFISHMGTSTLVGHYVCHLLKDGRWVIFNDEKVAQSENTPKDLGYIYLYRRR